MSRPDRPTSAKSAYFNKSSTDFSTMKNHTTSVIRLKKTKPKLPKPNANPNKSKVSGSKHTTNPGVVKYRKRTLWSSKNSVSHKPIKKKKLRQDFSSHSPRANDSHVYLEYATPNRGGKKIRFNETTNLTPSKFNMTGYSTLNNFNPSLSMDKRVPKDFRIQRTNKAYASTGKFDPHASEDHRSVKSHQSTNANDESKSTIRKLQSKSQYLHNLADKSMQQVLSNHKVSPGNMYFSNGKQSTAAADLEEEFTRRLHEDGTGITTRTIRHASQTFDKVINQDNDFGNLLTKIKNAYETYIK